MSLLLMLNLSGKQRAPTAREVKKVRVRIREGKVRHFTRSERKTNWRGRLPRGDRPQRQAHSLISLTLPGYVIFGNHRPLMIGGRPGRRLKLIEEH